MSERRQTQIEGGNDRRVIPRFSDSRVHLSFKQIRTCLVILTGVLGLAAALRIGFAFVKGPEAISKGAFDTVILAGLAIILFQYSSSIKIYLASESKDALDRTVEQQFVFWRTLTVLVILLLIVQGLSFL